MEHDGLATEITDNRVINPFSFPFFFNPFSHSTHSLSPLFLWDFPLLWKGFTLISTLFFKSTKRLMSTRNYLILNNFNSDWSKLETIFCWRKMFFKIFFLSLKGNESTCIFFIFCISLVLISYYLSNVSLF